MSSAAECEANFKNLLKSQGLLTQKRWEMMKNLGYNNMHDFAMSCGFLDQTPETADFKALILSLNEDPYVDWEEWESDTEYDEDDLDEPLELRAFRKVWWECSQTAKKESNQKHADNQEDTITKLTDAHRASRRKAFKDKYGPYTAELSRPLLEPSHYLEDEFHQWVQLNEIVRYVGPADCTNTLMEWHFKQKKENQTIPKIKSIEDLQKRLAPTKEAQTTQVPTCPVLFECLQRRGIAMELNKLAMYNEHNKWVQTLRDATDSTRHPNEVLPDIDDCLKADFAFWRLIREETRDHDIGVRESHGEFLLHALMEKFRQHWEISRALAPKTAHTRQQGTAGTKRAATPPVAGNESKTAKRRKKAAEAKARDKAKLKSLEAAVKGATKGRGKGRGKGKGKGKEKGKGAGKGNLPQAMVGKGCHAKNPAGESICFRFNLSECKFGENCRNGKHICAKCFGAHAFKECPAA